MLAQPVPHCVSPAAQLAAHFPCEHKRPLVQAIPQAPQLLPSDVVLAHRPAQAVSPAVQVQAPLVQLWPSAQTLPQLPQF